MHADAVIVGAGLAGLTCALKLSENGLTVKVLEQSGRVGGRVRTDERDGFLLDRGFQVFLTGYPNASRLLDYERLDFRHFASGALVRRKGKFHRLADPTRNPAAAFATLQAPIGTLSDKWGVFTMRQSLVKRSVDEIFSAEEMTTHEALKERWGFTDDMIDGFFRPFIGGVTLDTTLQASSRFLEFVMRMFAEGSAVVPAAGMQAIPDQLAARLPDGSLMLNRAVERVLTDGSVELADGYGMTADNVIVATDGRTAHRLTDGAIPEVEWSSAICLYFSADRAPVEEPILVLNGSGEGIVNNFAVMSAVSDTYAPPETELMSVTVLERAPDDDRELERQVRTEMNEWFGPSAGDWKLVEIQRIPRALPKQTPPALEPPQRSVALSENLFVCGDHRDTASIEGAIISGQRTAEAILATA